MHDLDHDADNHVPPSIAAHANGTPPVVAAALPRAIPAETRWLCGELARQARDFYPDRDWSGVAPILQRIWTREPRGIDWLTAAPLIHAAWQGA